MQIKKSYVLGFVFDETFSNVLLIHKNRPEWQKGMMNGIGGKIEAGEDVITAMEREMREEAGLSIPKTKWNFFMEKEGKDWIVNVLTTVWEGPQAAAESKTDERIEWFPISALPKNVINNLHWTVPLCIDVLLNERNNKILHVNVTHR